MVGKNIPRLRYTGFFEHYELSVFGGEEEITKFSFRNRKLTKLSNLC